MVIFMKHGRGDSGSTYWSLRLSTIRNARMAEMHGYSVPLSLCPCSPVGTSCLPFSHCSLDPALVMMKKRRVSPHHVMYVCNFDFLK